MLKIPPSFGPYEQILSNRKHIYLIQHFCYAIYFNGRIIIHFLSLFLHVEGENKIEEKKKHVVTNVLIFTTHWSWDLIWLCYTISEFITITLVKIMIFTAILFFLSFGL